MATNKFKQSLADGQHKKLLALIGNWRGLTKTWFEKDILADESQSEGTISSLLEDRFICFDYRGSLNGKAFVGKMIIGFDIPYQRFTTSWIDTFHMGTQIMLSSGPATPNGFSVLGSFGSPEYGIWGWRTELKVLNDGEIQFTAYNVSPEGAEAKAIETSFKRY